MRMRYIATKYSDGFEPPLTNIDIIHHPRDEDSFLLALDYFANIQLLKPKLASGTLGNF